MNDFWCVHGVMLPSPQTILEHFHYPQKKHHHPLNLSILPSLSPRQPWSIFSLSWFAYSGHFIYMEFYNIQFLWWASFTQHNVLIGFGGVNPVYVQSSTGVCWLHYSAVTFWPRYQVCKACGFTPNTQLPSQVFWPLCIRTFSCGWIQSLWGMM